MTATNPREKIGGNNPPPIDALLREKHSAIFKRLASWVRKAREANLSPQTIEDCVKLEALYADGRDLTNDAKKIHKVEKDPYLEASRMVDGVFLAGVRDVVGNEDRAGTASKLLQAAADRRLAFTREEQRQKDVAAEAARKEAEKLALKAGKQEDKGQVRQADVTMAQATATADQADALAAEAAAPVQEASRTRTGGVTSSVNAVLVCTGVIRGDLDLEALRPYILQAHLEAAVAAGLKMGAFKTLKGASITEQAKGSVRR